MKPNAPEKIYLEKVYPDNGVLPNGLNYNQSPNDIEYIKKDSFIEKACEWLRDNYLQYPSEDYADTTKFVMDFKKYMEGE